MSAQLNAYLNFDSTSREAMEFYRSVLGGTLDVMTFGDYGAQGESAGLVMHAQLVTDDGFVLMASDRMPEMGAVVRGDHAQLCLSGDDVDRLHRWWEGLAEGGEVGTPLAEQMWGDEYGDLTDRFGQRWLFNIARGGRSETA